MKLSEVNEVAEREFGEEPDSVEEIVGGVMNKTLRLKYGEESYILQINESTEAHEMENNLNCFQYFQDSEVPVPQIVTEEVREYDSSLYIIVEDLKAETLNEDITPEKTRDSGKYLAYIHSSQSFDKAGWWEWEDGEPEVIGFPDDSLKGRIEDNLEDNLEYFREEGIDWLVEVSERFLDDYLGLIPTNFEAVFVHHDYNPGNILVEDGEIVGILDFDYAHSSHGQRDLVKAANNFWIRGKVDRENIYEGYREVGELDESFNQNEPLYRLETLIDILKGFIEHDQITVEEAQEYESHISEIEEELEESI
jgi:aminoglycoside phosphotransferase (APT) family kinase protein